MLDLIFGLLDAFSVGRWILGKIVERHLEVKVLTTPTPLFYFLERPSPKPPTDDSLLGNVLRKPADFLYPPLPQAVDADFHIELLNPRADRAARVIGCKIHERSKSRFGWKKRRYGQTARMFDPSTGKELTSVELQPLEGPKEIRVRAESTFLIPPRHAIIELELETVGSVRQIRRRLIESMRLY